MINVFLSHNPFLNESKLTIEGENIPADSTLAERINAPLSHWAEQIFDLLGAYLNWPNSICFCFQGLETDYDDLQLAAEAARQKGDITIEMSLEAIAPPIQRLEELKALFQEAQTGPLKKLQSDDFKAKLHQALDPSFEVNVIATVSSGKSTVINSLLGRDLLPARNEATTATLTRIHDAKNQDNFEGYCLDTDEELLCERQTVSLSLLNDWNADPRTTRIDLFGPIPAIAQHEHVRLILVDTPGPNNSRDDRHALATRHAITHGAMTLVLYILNARNLAVDDDKHLLGMVCETLHKGGKQAHDRFIFLVNQIDEIDPEKHESIEKTLGTARAYLEENGIRNPILLPVSARLAKLVRLEASGTDTLSRLDRNFLGCQRDRFVEEADMHTAPHMSLSPSVRQRNRALLERAEIAGDRNELALLHSGIPSVALVLEEYLSKYALPYRVFKAQALFETYLQQAEDEAQAYEELKHMSERELGAIRTELQRIDASIEQGRQSQRLKDELKSKPFVIPDLVQKDIAATRAQFQRQQTILVNKLNQDGLEPSLAKQLIDMARSEAEEIRKDALVRFENALQSAQQIELERLSAAYQAYVISLFGGGAQPVRLPTVDKLCAAALGIPPTSRLVEDHSRNEVVDTKTVSVFVWYKPWTYFHDDKVIDVYGTRVNLKPVAETFSAELRTNFNALLDSATTALKIQAQQACASFIEAMEQRLDQELKRLVQEAEQAASDSQTRERKIAEAEKNLAWIAAFKRKLAAIVSVY